MKRPPFGVLERAGGNAGREPAARFAPGRTVRVPQVCGTARSNSPDISLRILQQADVEGKERHERGRGPRTMAPAIAPATPSRAPRIIRFPGRSIRCACRGGGHRQVESRQPHDTTPQAAASSSGHLPESRTRSQAPRQAAERCPSRTAATSLRAGSRSRAFPRNLSACAKRLAAVGDFLHPRPGRGMARGRLEARPDRNAGVEERFGFQGSRSVSSRGPPVRRPDSS